MDNCSKSLCGGQQTVALENIFSDMNKNTGRELNCLEQDIVRMLYHNHLSDKRFVTDENNTILACETEDRAGIVELTEDYDIVFKTMPVYSVSSKDIAGRISSASGQMLQELFVCGAQPLASLLSLSSAMPANASAQADLKNAIRATGAYSNTYGIPMVGGGMFFNDWTKQGTTANLFAIGLIDKNAKITPSCYGTGNLVCLIGNPGMADSQPQPEAFAARTVYELVCDLHDEDIIVSMQSVGQSGIIGACIDMIANGTNGIGLFADTLICEADDHQKLLAYTPNEIVLIVKEAHRKNLEKACRKWNRQCVQIGTVIQEYKLSVTYRQATIADLPALMLSIPDNAAKNDVDVLPPAASYNPSSSDIPQPENYQELAKFMLTCPNLLSQQWFFEQFDSTAGANNLSTNFISDSSVLKLKGARHALAVSFCHNTSDIRKYPEAVNHVMAESLRKVICSGGTPHALTGCLNYSGTLDNPAREHIHAVTGNIALTCKKAGITSSGISVNCSEQKGNPAISNISVGTIAFLNDKHQQMTISFKEKGDMIYLLGKSSDNLDSSEYIRAYHNILDAPPPRIDWDTEIKLLNVAQRIIARRLVKSAHSISQGGLFMALLESAMVRSLGFDITVDDEIRKDAFLFGASPSRIVVSVSMAREADFIDFMMETEVPFLTLGHVTREEIRIDDNSYGFIGDYKKRYMGAN